MKNVTGILAAVCLIVCSQVHADASTKIDAAGAAYGAKDYGRCADIMAKLYHGPVALPDGGELFYVECLAAADRTNAALRVVSEEASTGRINIDDLAHKDRPGLNKLRSSKAWPGVFASIQRQDADRQARIDQPLRKVLLERFGEDQAVRQQAIAQGGGVKAFKQARPIDQDNTAWLKKVVDEKGWPGISLVGADGYRAAFFLAQHADFDIAFQEKVLRLMQAALVRHDVHPDDLAMLDDRVRIGQGKMQLYGTQFETAEDGSMSMQPTQDLAHLDPRRLSMGLPPIAEYKRSLSVVYRKKVR